MWQEPLPKNVVVKGPVRLAIESDLRPDGRFGRQWLVVTDDRLVVLAEVHDNALPHPNPPPQRGEGDGAIETRLDVPLADLKDAKAQELVGGGAVEAVHDGRRIELIRYTAAKVPRFAAAAQAIEKWAKGEKAELPEEEIRRCPRCGLPLAKGTLVCPACLPKGRTLRRLIGYVRPYRRRVIGMSLIAFVATGISLIPPYLTKPLVDQVLSPVLGRSAIEPRLVLLGLLVMGLFLAHLLRGAITALQFWLVAWLGNRLTHDIRCQLYRQLQYLSLRFFDKRQIGTVISRVNQDTGELQRFLVWGSQDLVTDVLLFVGIGVFLFVLNWRLALLVFIPAPFVMLVSAKFWRWIRYYLHRFFHRWARLNSLLSETLTGLRVVKSFAQERREVARFGERSADLAQSSIQVERAWAIVWPGMELLIFAGTLLVWYVGGREIIFGRNHMTLGTLMAFLAFVAMFYRPVQSLSVLLNWASRSLTAAERVFEVLDSEPEVRENAAAKPLPRIDGRVEFKGVTFGYDRHRPVLKGVSFEARPGEMIGLVGQSGAGKSTTVNLLCRFYDPDEGEVLVDGVPLDELRLEDLRRQIGVVPQDTFLFSGTIFDNIAYAKPDAAKEEIIQAAKVANAHAFIAKKPDGYETLLGEDGKGLSAGEKQRIAIARAVLHNPRILILDEATSQVDVETEKQIQEAIQRLVAGRTTFAIAHRLSTLKNADRLIVLKEGAIAEMGTHDELLAKEDGEFHKLVKMYQEVSKVHEVQR